MKELSLLCLKTERTKSSFSKTERTKCCLKLKELNLLSLKTERTKNWGLTLKESIQSNVNYSSCCKGLAHPRSVGSAAQKAGEYLNLNRAQYSFGVQIERTNETLRLIVVTVSVASRRPFRCVSFCVCELMFSTECIFPRVLHVLLQCNDQQPMASFLAVMVMQ